VFSGKVAFIHPHLDASTRTLKVRLDMKNSDHELRPGMYATVRLDVPTAQLDSFAHALEEDWRHLTMVSGVAHGLSAAVLAPQNGVEGLLETAGKLALLRSGLVLAVPESAVIDTGTRKFVYRQAWPGAYDAVEVQLGTRCGGFFAVFRGLAAGDKVVTAGSFLVDAETRLTSGAASTYFGASGAPGDKHAGKVDARPSMGIEEDIKANAALAKLSRVDQRLAAAQGFCPILPQNRLGSMGAPLKVMLKNEPVFLCCGGCESNARTHEAQTLAKVDALKATLKAGMPPASK
jgi:hypothetical protein